MGKVFKIEQDDEMAGATFSVFDKIIVIGKKTHEGNMLSNIVHEISEIIHILLNHRLERIENNSHVFLFEHSGFQSHNEILIDTLITNKIIKIDQ